MTSIEWTDKSWNPISGCTKVSAGCKHCYAESIANRFWGDRPFSDVQFHESRLAEPQKRKKPTMWFVNSMSDLFHESVTFAQLFEIASVMLSTPQHTYQVLTKRPGRMLEIWPQVVGLLQSAVNGTALNPPNINPLPNVWLGVSVENQKAADERISLLLQTPAAIRFLSCEPLLEEVALMGLHHLNDDGSGIDWVIVGGESGSGARPCDIAWIRSIVSQCKDAEVPVFVKQLGSNPQIEDDALVGSCFVNRLPLNVICSPRGKGGNPEEWPKDLRVRQYPAGKRGGFKALSEHRKGDRRGQ